MKVAVQKLHPDAVLPEFVHSTDAGADLCCVEWVEIPSGGQVTIPTGIALGLPDGWACLIWDKSGVSAKRQLKVMGGVVDAGYRGEVMVTLHNLGAEPQVFEPGDKIAQALFQQVERPEFAEGDLDESDRGDKGFGSTGR